MLLILAALLAMLSYISISANLPEGEITIKFGKKKKATAAN
jgi:hypothetical protein